YWKSEARQEVSRIPVDYEGVENTEASVGHVVVRLGTEQTRALLQEAPKIYNAQIEEVMIAALAEAVSWWGGASRGGVEVEGHGREELEEAVDVTRTVGWFTSIYPVVINVGGKRGGVEVLKRVKEKMRRAPRRGMGYGVLRYLATEGRISEELKAGQEAE